LLWANDFRAVFWVAIFPAVLSVAMLGFGVVEPAGPRKARSVNPIGRADLRRVWPAVWRALGLRGGVAPPECAGRFFQVRGRLQQSGLALALVPLVLIAMNVVYSVAAYPFG